MIKIIHIADIHARREAMDKVLHSLFVVRQVAESNGVDLICISGDTWDQTIHASEGSGFNQTIDAIKDLAETAPVVMIYGTPSHDIEGSLDVFGKLNTRYGITVLQAGKPYFLDDEWKIREYDLGARAIIFGVPEPNKKWLMPVLETKTAAEAAVRDGLKGFFQGLGGLRKEHSEIPCLLMYHGQVAGARLQNGDTLDRGEGMRATVDDLAAVGAEYIALGDIHQPQQVGETIGLQAYYSGSAYPINFGETHDAGLNLITLFAPRQPAKVERISFGHRINQTIKIKAVPDMFGSINLEHDLVNLVKGRRLKLEVTVSKEHASMVDIAGLQQEIVRKGAAQDSTVVLNVLPTETTRAGEIADIQGLPGKLKLWADNSAKALPDEVYVLAEQLEANARGSGLIGSGARIRLDKLVLRGAIGIWAKSRMDEVVFDFQEFDHGLIAILGKNGDGKTTLLENMHPWPCMLTRSGTMQDHFRQRDSMRDLYWTDEATGIRYRALITIDAGIKSGKTEYYLYQDSGSGFQPVVGINGRKDMYITEINRLFGSMDLYLRSAFVTQRQPKGQKDLGDASPGERKALFSELVGLEYFEAYKSLAAEKVKALESTIQTAQTQVSAMQTTISQKDGLVSLLNKHETSIPALIEERDGIAKAGELANEVIKGMQEEATKQAELKRDLAGVRTRLQELLVQSRHARENIARLENTLAGKENAEKIITEYESLKAEEEVEHGKYRTWSEKQRQAQLELNNRLQAHADEDRRLRDMLARIQREQDQQASNLASLEKDRQRMVADLEKPVADHCPTCKQMLPDDALAHVQESRAKVQSTLDHLIVEIDASKTAMQMISVRLQKAVEDIAVHERLRPAPVEPTAFDQAELKRIREALSWLDIEAARRTVLGCQTAATEIVLINRSLSQNAHDTVALQSKEAVLVASIKPEDMQESIRAFNAHVADLRNQYSKTVAAIASSEQAISMLKIQLESISKIELGIARINAEIATNSTVLSHWNILVGACSDKGIPALELDAVAPGIASIANNLLKDAFDSRYQIEFSTTRIGGSGQQIEGFDIQVLDTTTGDTQEISTLSGGEAVWIRRALYDAFGIIRARNTGLQFQTVFMDEADGALDPEARVTYLRMLEAAHHQACRSHSLIITHSPELQALIQQKVSIRDLPARKEQAEEPAEAA